MKSAFSSTGTSKPDGTDTAPYWNPSNLLVLLFLLLAFVIIRNAWVCDDAYISFRTVDNLIHGHGLTWNPGERVQAFTHPLWVIVVAVLYSITGEVYYTTLLLSLLLTLTSVYLITRYLIPETVATGLVITFLLLSKAFIDYATSGLENALSYALLAGFAAVLLSGPKQTIRKLFWLSLLSALLALNRLDLLLLTLPSLVWYFVQTPRGKRVIAVAMGTIPLLVWEVFSIFYYGFPLPNTYYAKLNTGLPRGELIRQGFSYYLDTLDIDPLTLIVIASAVLVSFVWKRRSTVALASGLSLYMVYIVWVGGDFMSGRFFSVPFLLAVVLLSRHELPGNNLLRILPFVVVVLIGLLSPRSPLTSSGSYGTTGEGGINARGIADERAWYYQRTGLLNRNRAEIAFSHPWLTSGKNLRLRKIKVSYQRTVGFVGYAAGPDVHIVDGYALAEPLLARLLVTERYTWRIGHFLRPMPNGYMKTLHSGKNVIADSSLAAYYDKLSIVIRGPVFDLRRFATIWHMNIGSYDYLIDGYTKTPMIHATYTEASHVKEEGTKWNAKGTYVIRPTGLRVALDSVAYNERLEVSVDHNDSYYVVFRHGRSEVGWMSILPDPRSGLRVDTLEVPYAVHLGGYDSIDIVPYDGDDMYSVGHILLLE